MWANILNNEVTKGITHTKLTVDHLMDVSRFTTIDIITDFEKLSKKPTTSSLS